MRSMYHIVTVKRNSGTASAKLTDHSKFSDVSNTLMCVGNSTSARSTTISLQVISRSCVLGPGVLTSYNPTNIRAHGRAKLLSQFLANKQTKLKLFLLAHKSTQTLSKLMSTDLTVAANSNQGPVTSTTQTCVHTRGRKAISPFLNKRKQDFLIFATHDHACMRWMYHITFNRDSPTASAKRTG